LDFPAATATVDGMSTAQIPTVIWVGGGSGAGKTTISRAIAYRHDLAWYRIDARAYAHRDLLVARGEISAESVARSHDQRWLDPTPEDLARSFVEGSARLLPLVLEDLQAMPSDVAVIVEGPQLLPWLVEPHLTGKESALWLLPTDEFRRRALAARHTASKATSDAERAQANLLARNAILDARTRSEATALGLRVVDVDGTRDVSATIAYVTELLGPVLADAPRARTGRQRSTFRRVENDAMMTNVTAWLADLGPHRPDGPLELPFACECERLGCTAELMLGPAAYEAARDSGRAITAPGPADHEGSPLVPTPPT
jgi:hypothetical protein